MTNTYKTVDQGDSSLPAAREVQEPACLLILPRGDGGQAAVRREEQEGGHSQVAVRGEEQEGGHSQVAISGEEQEGGTFR